MNIHRLALPALALVLTASGFVTTQGYGQSQAQEPQTAPYGPASGGWDTPPQEF